jgi:hypothetical protein
VQALRYEAVGKDGDSLLNLLVDRAAVNLEIANYLHWYLFCQQLVEADAKDLQGRPRCFEPARRRLITTPGKHPNPSPKPDTLNPKRQVL